MRKEWRRFGESLVLVTILPPDPRIALHEDQWPIMCSPANSELWQEGLDAEIIQRLARTDKPPRIMPPIRPWKGFTVLSHRENGDR